MSVLSSLKLESVEAHCHSVETYGMKGLDLLSEQIYLANAILNKNALQ